MMKLLGKKTLPNMMKIAMKMIMRMKMTMMIVSTMKTAKTKISSMKNLD